MAAERPQYYPNTLAPIKVNRDTLQQVLQELRDATRSGADMVRKNVSPPEDGWGASGFFYGISGIALVFLRLDHQAASLAKDNEATVPDFRTSAIERIFPEAQDLPLIPSRLSPLGSFSPFPAAVLHILAAASSNEPISKDDIRPFYEGIDLALKNGHVVPHDGNNFGGDEILYGRSGLLWSILVIRSHSHRFNEKTRKALDPLFEAVPKLVDLIVEGGRQGANDYSKKHGDKEMMPLMYMWMEGFYCLGAVHGAGGIISALLACNEEELNDGASRNHYPLIAATVTCISKVTIANNGHLPACIPHRQIGSATSTLVQVCHGSPGILLLMGCVMRNSHLMSNYWQPEWDQAVLLATERIWEEGLLSKGLGICHGITGNAWPLMLMHDCFEYEEELMVQARKNYNARVHADDSPITQSPLTGDYFLSKALALLLHVREAPPYNSSSEPGSNDYRMPDLPYSLSEGLPGTICAWSESCVVIQAKLRKMELDEQGKTSAAAREQDATFQEVESRHLGYPALPYHRPVNLF